MQKKVFHLSQLHWEIAPDAVFNLIFVDSSGALIETGDCTCTSWYSEGLTLNLRFAASGEIRTIRRNSIVEFNGVQYQERK